VLDEDDPQHVGFLRERPNPSLSGSDTGYRAACNRRCQVGVVNTTGESDPKFSRE
jgi:hypothetical protein